MARAHAPQSSHTLQLSVSQIETFRLCPRKWAWQKIDGLEDPGNEAAQLGQRVHDVAEQYFKHGTPLDMTTQEAKILMPGLAHLPPPKYPGMEVEQWFTVEIGPALFRGLKDLQILEGWPKKGGRPWVSDHKTTKSFEWSKSSDDLLENIQAGVYSYDVHVKHGVKEFDLQWTYMKTQGPPQAFTTLATMTYDPMMRVIESVEQTALEIEAIKKTCSTALEVPYKASGCAAFGGCRFVKNCNLTAKEELRSIMTQQKLQSNLLSQLAARKAAKAAGSAGASEEAGEPEKAPEVAEPAPVKKANSLLSRVKAPAPSKAAQEAAREPASSEEAQEPAEELVAINPPESILAPSDAVVAERAEEKKKKGRPAKSELPASQVSGDAQALGDLLAVVFDRVLDGLATRIANKLKEK